MKQMAMKGVMAIFVCSCHRQSIIEGGGRRGRDRDEFWIGSTMSVRVSRGSFSSTFFGQNRTNPRRIE